jgi:GDPmannose 4,6-dehydratase
MKSAIIFGSNGQDGFYLNKLLNKYNISVLNVSRKNSDIDGDISDFNFVKKLIKKIKPDFIFHFAAISSTSHEFLFENHNAISNGTLNILSAVNDYSNKSRVFISGSALQFKNFGEKINENSEFDNSSCYSVERIYSVYLSRYFRNKFNLKIYIGYLFNHDSFLRSDSHINKKIVNSILKIANGSTDKILIGNLDVIKEFNFAGDIVEAIWILINQDEIFETVIGSGKGYSLENWIEECFRIIGINYSKDDHIMIDTSFRPDFKYLVSDPSLIYKLGWKPKISFKKMAEIMMRNQIDLKFNKNKFD